MDEGRLLARLRHPHIVSVYGAARIDGQVGLWMEFLRGRTLAQAVATDGALPTRKVAEIGAALCDALAAVHKAGLVHRDVKAQNVMLADDGRVVLMDFGAGGDLRHVGLDMAGTPLYLAPEVARGAPASPQSDIYSLGVLLRYAATGAYSRDVACPTNDKALKRLIAVAATASARDATRPICIGRRVWPRLRDLLAPPMFAHSCRCGNLPCRRARRILLAAAANGLRAGRRRPRLRDGLANRLAQTSAAFSSADHTRLDSTA